MKYLLSTLLFLAGCNYEPGRCLEYSQEEFNQIEEENASLWPGPGEYNLNNIRVFCVDNLDAHPEAAERATGITYSYYDHGEKYSDIYIIAFPVLRATAYTHETIHAVLWNNVSWLDPDHSEGTGDWNADHDLMVVASFLNYPGLK